jgi:hypothetical protein
MIQNAQYCGSVGGGDDDDLLNEYHSSDKMQTEENHELI